MTDRERFVNQLHHRAVDRCFNMEFGYWQENFSEWQGFIDAGITDNVAADVFFSFDRVGGAGTAWMLPAMETLVLEEREKTNIIRNGEGLICEVPKDGHSTIPHYLGSTIKTPADWAEVKRHHLNPDNPDRKPDVAALRARLPDDRDFAAGVNAGSMIGKIRDLLTTEGLAYAIYDYPTMVEDMIETACVLIENYLDAVLPHVRFDFATGWEDICFRSGPLVSVSYFETVIVPRYKRIGEKLRAHGIDIWYTDCDGDIRPLLPGFLDAGINCMFPLEVSCSGNPATLLDEYGSELRILGGVDKGVIAQGEPAIRDYLTALLPYVERGGFIPFCDHRCPPTVSWENYIRYLDIKQELFG
jgi:uroporphyrinogen decarboxylase